MPTKFTDLTDEPNPAGADLVAITDDVAGTPTTKKATLTNLSKAIDHDQLVNFLADEHIAHSGVDLTAGAGLTGGGTIDASRSFAVGAGDGIAVNADDVALAIASLTSATVAPGDLVAVADIDDSNTPKKVTAQSIADLAGASGASLTGNITLPAEAFVVPSSGGALQEQIAGTNYDYIRLAFDDSTDEFAAVKIAMPEDWDGGALDVTIVWSDGGTTANDVVWVVAMDRVEAGSTPDTSPTAAATITSTADAAADETVYSTSTGITKPTGLAAGDMAFVKLTRDADVAGDTMTGDAHMHLLRIEYTRSTA